MTDYTESLTEQIALADKPSKGVLGSISNNLLIQHRLSTTPPYYPIEDAENNVISRLSSSITDTGTSLTVNTTFPDFEVPSIGILNIGDTSDMTPGSDGTPPNGEEVFYQGYSQDASTTTFENLHRGVGNTNQQAWETDTIVGFSITSQYIKNIFRHLVPSDTGVGHIESISSLMLSARDFIKDNDTVELRKVGEGYIEFYNRTDDKLLFRMDEDTAVNYLQGNLDFENNMIKDLFAMGGNTGISYSKNKIEKGESLTIPSGREGIVIMSKYSEYEIEGELVVEGNFLVSGV